MITLLSLATSTKDYFEIVHKLLEYHPSYTATDYAEVGTLVSYAVLSIKSFLIDLLSFNWLQNIWSLPIIVPDIASAMISEISVLDGYFHNAFTFLETPLSYGNQNYSVYGLEKFIIGFINSFFLFLPTSAAHIILIRRFIFQGIEGGYLAGIGIIAGNILWLSSIIFGWRFFVIPWLSLDILRYLLGFGILIKFMWHASRDQRRFSNLSKSKMILVNFLLAFTEQTSIYPFVTNMSIGAESSIMETFPVDHLGQFFFIHSAYIFGLLAGSLSLLNFTCWLWENPIADIYNWLRIRGKLPRYLYKYLSFVSLYFIMLGTISSVPYFGLDYTITNPLGLVSDDRILYETDPKTMEPLFPQASFLNTKASDPNLRDSRGRHGRRERWKHRLLRYKGADTTLYDQAVFDLFPIEDLNYGFDRFWLRRKMRVHYSRFRMLLVKPYLVATKTALLKPKLISKEAPRIELFRMLFAQYYHPDFHAYSNQNKQIVSSSKSASSGNEGAGVGASEKKSDEGANIKKASVLRPSFTSASDGAALSNSIQMDNKLDNKLGKEFSALRKFVRKVNTRIKSSEILLKNQNLTNKNRISASNSLGYTPIYSKFLHFNKQVLSQLPKMVGINRSQQGADYLPSKRKSLQNLRMPINDFTESWQTLKKNDAFNSNFANRLGKASYTQKNKIDDNQNNSSFKEEGVILNKKDRKILRYKTLLANVGTPLSPSAIQALSESELDSEVSDQNQKGAEMEDYNLNNKPRSRIETLFNSSFFKGKGEDLKKKKSLAAIEGQGSFQINNAKTMLHPIKFYLQKEKAFRRKFKFYGASVFRKLSIENNAPHFRTMMKGLFYYYKPTLRWTSTIKIAKNRQRFQRRTKKSRASLALPFMPKNKRVAPNASIFASEKEASRLNRNQARIPVSLQKPTHPFRVIGKNASLIRNQITKHLLHNWFYAPFNRTLVKLDVDSFIRRQPNSHFLTKKDEQGLHLKRFLLAEHYETLRWYTYMQHYRSMKTKIGGTKSFASRVYNQQFQGTLKKIRHLFAITPSQSDIFTKLKDEGPSLLSFLTRSSNPKISEGNSILKFDQPLYNEYANSKTNSFINDSVIHEELLSPYQNQKNKNQSFIKDDFIAQSTLIVRNYLQTARPIRQQIIKDLLLKKNYREFTKFVFNGQKIRGIKATTNQRSLLNQEKFYLSSPSPDPQSLPSQAPVMEGPEKSESEEAIYQKNQNIQLTNFLQKTAKNLNIEQDLWFSLLQNYRKGLYDQEFLNSFIARRWDKIEERKTKKKIGLQKRLKRLKKWLAPNNKNPNLKNSTNLLPGSQDSNSLTTGLNKAIKEGFLLFEIKKNEPLSITQTETGIQSEPVLSSILTQLSIEKEYKKEYNKDDKTRFNTTKQYLVIGITKAKVVSHVLKKKIKAIIKSIGNKSNNFVLLKSIREKDPQWWVQKNRMLDKRKGKRKEYVKEIKKVFKKSRKSRRKPNFTYAKFVKMRLNIFERLRFEAGYTSKMEQKDLAEVKRLFLGKSDTQKDISETKKPKASGQIAEIAETAKQKLERLKKEMYHRIAIMAHNEYLINLKKWKESRDAVDTECIKNLELTPGQVDLFRTRRDLYKKRIKSYKLWRKSQKRRRASYTISHKPKNPLSKTKDKKKGNKKDDQKRKKNNRENFSVKRLITSLKERLKQKEDRFGPVYQYYGDKSYDELNKSLVNPAESTGPSAQRERGPRRKEAIEGRETAKSSMWWSRLSDAFWSTTKKVDFGQTQKGKDIIKMIRQKYKREKNRRNRQLRLNIHGRYALVKPLPNDVNLERRNDLNAPSRLETIKEIVNSHNKKSLFVESVPKKTRSKNKQWKKLKKMIHQDKRRKTPKQDQKDIKAFAYHRAKTLIKQIKRIKFNLYLQQWWWQKFIPSLQAIAETTFKLEHDQNLQQKMSTLPKATIFKRDSVNTNQLKQGNSLQIGDLDFKPLAIPQALRIREDLIKQKLLQLNAPTFMKKFPSLSSAPLSVLPGLTTVGSESAKQGLKKHLVNTNSLPFYAGWDESLRKFVVTNRLLSRRDAGYSVSSLYSTYADIEDFEFSNAPLKGMNSGTTLYCHNPFTTFAPDQMYKPGMGGFAPIGWRRFEFTHTIFKTNTLYKWLTVRSNKNKMSTLVPPLSVSKSENQTETSQKPLLIKSISPLFSFASGPQGKSRFSDPEKRAKNNSSSNLESQSLNSTDLFLNRAQMISFKKPYNKNFDTIKKKYAYSRRIVKHTKKIKKVKQKVLSPGLLSGPLIHEVLPFSYINIFNKQNRLTKDRYIKRRLKRGKRSLPKMVLQLNKRNQNIAAGKTNLSSAKLYPNVVHTSEGRDRYDFTFRRRIKTRRKYHRKSKTNYVRGVEVRPRRHTFLAKYDYLFNSSPVDIGSLTDKTEQLNKITLDKKGGVRASLSVKRKRPSKRRKIKKIGGPSTAQRNVTSKKRKPDTKRREKRQVFKPHFRRHPRSGGFMWPGDYLRLLPTGSPQLTLMESKDIITDQSLEEAEKRKIIRIQKRKLIPLDVGLPNIAVQPRKYLLEKHNIKVITRKLEKAQRTNQIKQRIKELELIL